jgi:hypothetical protein
MKEHRMTRRFCRRVQRLEAEWDEELNKAIEAELDRGFS